MEKEKLEERGKKEDVFKKKKVVLCCIMHLCPLPRMTVNSTHCKLTNNKLLSYRSWRNLCLGMRSIVLQRWAHALEDTLEGGGGSPPAG